MKYDFILKHGHVIDPYNEIDTVMDLAVRDGKVAALAPDLCAAEAAAVYDMTGLYVTPGLIDTHAHFYYTGGLPGFIVGDRSLMADYFTFPAGVTTVVDAGTADSKNFAHFRTTVIDRAKSRFFASLNIADYGMSTYQSEQFPETNSVEGFVRCWEENKDIIRGIKVAHYWGEDWGQIDCAKRVQEKTGLPIMVDYGHFRPGRPYDQLVLEKLDAGDIATHCFRAPVPIVDDDGKVYDYLWKAKERGIWFDLGHGCESFVFRSAVPAMRQGFIPDVFSTDLHAANINGAVMDMANILSKMLACCEMPLIDLFRRVTANPAKMMKLDGAGNLSLGADADIAVWTMREGEFGFTDGKGRLTGSKKLECEITFRGGKVVWDRNARTYLPYEELPAWYGISAPDARVIPTR